MAASIENTATFRAGVEKEHSRRVLEKARKMEAKREKQGWKYVSISHTTQVLVPCDKNGLPTKEGLVKIQRLKNIMGIK